MRPAQTAPRRIAVIGDVGGHADELRRELRRLGADPEHGRLPAELHVIQVGDLIHRGPDSAGVVALVDGYLQRQPTQWTQLVGNHEAQYLRDRAFEWPEQLDPDSATTLRRWWTDGSMRAATSVRVAGEDFLITHAGLTSGFWREVLDRLTRADLAAAALNSFIGTHEDVLFSPGQMLGSGRPNPLAGPIWASAATELVPSWLGIRMPFSQLHGHSTLTGGTSRRAVSAEISRRTTLDEPAQHESTALDSGRIIGIDPGHGVRPRRPWRSWTWELPPEA